MVVDAKATKGNKGLALPKFIVLGDGTQESTSFNDMTWGSITRTHMEFVNEHLRLSSLEKVIQKAKAFMVVNHTRGSRGTSDTTDVNGTSTKMVDLSDSGGECKQDKCSRFTSANACHAGRHRQRKYGLRHMHCRHPT